MPVVRILFVCMTAFLLSWGIDPYASISLKAPLFGLIVNAVLPLILALFVLGVSGRVSIAIIVSAVALGALRVANQIKESILETNIVYADFKIIPELLKDPHLVLDFLQPNMMLLAGALSGIIFIGMLWWIARREQSLHWGARLSCIGVALVALIVIGNVEISSTKTLMGWQAYAQPNGAKRVGISGNILLGGMASRDVKRPANPQLAAKFWDEPIVRQVAQDLSKEGTTSHPDIVLIQSESLFDPSQLCGMSDTPVLKHLAGQKPSPLDNLQVPVFGGRTLQTEFEAITGAPISFYNGSIFAYYDLLTQHVNAFPRFLGGIGYKSIAIHPNKRSFWNRSWAMSALGFQTFIDRDAFINPDDLVSPDRTRRMYVTDWAVMRSILAELDAAEKPSFIMAITMNNHGPWGKFAPQDDSALGLPENLKGEGRKQLADYISRSKDADEAYAFLLEALKRRGRPTIVVLYGDHLPALPDVYPQLCFKNGKPAPAQKPIYRAWANFPVPASPETSASYLLQGWIAKAASLPLNGTILANAIAGDIAGDASISASDRKRILNGYAHIAAANLERDVERNPSETKAILLDKDDALSTLAALNPAPPLPKRSSPDPEDLLMRPDSNGHSEQTFRPDEKVRRITLRPYLVKSKEEHCSAAMIQPIWFTVQGDGRSIYKASLTPQAFRLATLDLSGIKTITFQMDRTSGSDDCYKAYLRIVQMQCLTRTCSSPVPNAAASPLLTSRSLDGDALEGDLAALTSRASREAAAQPR